MTLPDIPAGGSNQRYLLAPEAFMRLQAWFSPAFPIGAFSYSHGLEWLVETGAVADMAALFDWLEGVLRYGAGRSEAIFLHHAWRRMQARDWAELQDIAAFASALQPTAERRTECLEQGSAFLTGVMAAWPHPALEEFTQAWPDPVAVSIAAGVAGAVHDIPLDALTVAFLQSFSASLVSAGVRLIPLGQSDGLRIIRQLEPVIHAVAEEAASCSLEDIGTATLLTDIASMRHETQYSRLFRS